MQSYGGFRLHPNIFSEIVGTYSDRARLLRQKGEEVPNLSQSGDNPPWHNESSPDATYLTFFLTSAMRHPYCFLHTVFLNIGCTPFVHRRCYNVTTYKSFFCIFKNIPSATSLSAWMNTWKDCSADLTDLTDLLLRRDLTNGDDKDTQISRVMIMSHRSHRSHRFAATQGLIEFADREWGRLRHSRWDLWDLWDLCENK